MKAQRTSSLQRSFANQNRDGQRSSALIIVLACLVFISVLIVAFFGSITTERQSSQFYANDSSVKLLSDSTLSIVMGQIVNGTRGTDANGHTLSWASQPGMIRTYNVQGSADGYYKLYSWTNMIGSGAFNPYVAGEQVPANWASSKAIYTDLNEPITEGSGVSTIANYPIVDPSATNTVVGFSIANTAPISITDYAPMPVQWLYVLQRGQVITPDAGGNGTTVTFAQAPLQPNATNQIVGRVAFWTDDDTSKVNINTAAGDVWVNANGSSSGPALGSPGNPGSSWDTPRLFSTTETNLAYAQPANGEYQRYPGHPSTVYLSAVFPTLLTTPAQIYALTPRVALGGSLSGTTYPSASMLTSGQVQSSRLYTSVDEMLSATNTTGTSPPVRNLNSPLTKSAIEQGKFFLTVASRAPEVNLYNQPRVVVWPVSSTGTIGTYCTAYDKLMAYCGTLNGNYYYFQRAPAGVSSTTADLPASASTTVPATDGSRNRQLITYLRNLTSQPVPGFSTANETFLSKYPKDRDEVLTEIFDYIRSLNTEDQGVSIPYTPVTIGTLGQGQIFPITDTTHADSNSTTLRGFGHFPIITEATLLFAGIGQTSNSGTATSVYSGGAVASGQTRIQAALLLKFFDPSQGYAPMKPNFIVKVTGLGGMTWNGSSIGFHDPATITVTSQVITAAQGTGGEIGVSPCVWATGYTDSSTGLISGNTLDVNSGTMAAPTTFTTSDTTFTVTITDTSGNTLQTYNLEFPAGTFPVPGLAPIVTDNTASAPAVTTADFRNLTARFNTNNTPMLQTYICGTDVARSIALTTDPRSIVPLANVPLQYSGGPNSGKNIYGKVAGYDTSTVLRAHGIFDMANGGHRGLVGYTTPGKLVNSTTYSGTETGTEPDFVYNPAAALSTAWSSGAQIQAVPTSASKGSGVVNAAGIFDANIFSLVSGYAVGTPGVFLPGSTTIPGDWDTGNSQDKDGAYINKADEGAIPYNRPSTGVFLPYYSAGYATSTTTGSSLIIASGANFSPNRQMPSAGMFGSLPTGVFSNAPWQTLLFRPSPDGNVLPSESPVHIGAQSPQDHLLMDLYTMPIVEPYAISDPFSTAGKVNMNYQIVPFTYLTRSTAVQAAMRAEQMVAVPGTMGIGPGFTGVPAYKGSTTATLRSFLDLGQTLTGFNNMFTTGTPDGTGSTPDIFRSATQICNIWLVPAGKSLTYAGMPAFWLNATASGGILTGDNVRERPYANLYQKLTTKSNTFTVHMRVQALKMVKAVDPTYASWTEAKDQTIGEYRGSSTIERYLDTSSSNIPDYATISQPPTAAQAISNFYKFRVIETKQFTP